MILSQQRYHEAWARLNHLKIVVEELGTNFDLDSGHLVSMEVYLQLLRDLYDFTMNKSFGLRHNHMLEVVENKFNLDYHSSNNVGELISFLEKEAAYLKKIMNGVEQNEQPENLDMFLTGVDIRGDFRPAF